MLFTVKARLVEYDCRGRRKSVVMNRNGQAVMLAFGKRGWLMGYRNRLWTMSELEGQSVDYYNDWPHMVTHFVIYMHWFKDEIGCRLFKKRRFLDLIMFATVSDATLHLLRLQRWFLKTCACRKARRLALAMATHARLGKDSPLATLDVDIVRALVLAAT